MVNISIRANYQINASKTVDQPSLGSLSAWSTRSAPCPRLWWSKHCAGRRLVNTLMVLQRVSIF